jgi:tetratricopeptide (TPR) repeat protein
VLINELGDEGRAEFALARAVKRDIRRTLAFDKLFRIVRAKKDNVRMLELITRRLEVADDPEEIAKLYWERARALREVGDRDGALSALDSVKMLEPDHVGALALAGEIYITKGEFAQAARSLGRLAELDSAPARQRLMSGVAAVDLYENKLGELTKALHVLVGLHRAGLSTLPVRERLARAAAKAESWQQATEVLEQLMDERETRDGRMEAARLALVIQRDRLGRPDLAGRSVVKLLGEQPEDPEALELVLSSALTPEESHPLLQRASTALIDALAEEPLDVERIERLSRVAEALDNPRLRQATLGVLFALGMGGAAIDRELGRFDDRVSRVPKTAIDEQSLPELTDPEDRGALTELMRALGTTLFEALGPNLATLGVTKKERVDARAGGALRDEIAAWATALGILEFDLYVGGSLPHAVHAVASERPAIVVGRAVTAPFGPQHRQIVARELFALRRGTTVLRYRDLGEVAAVIIVACKLGGHELQLPYGVPPDLERRIQKAMPRKVKKALPELSRAVVSERRDPIHWAHAAIATLDRIAVIAAGDASWVLADGDAAARGRLGASLETQERARRLSSFVLSPVYLELRERLGMEVR